MRRFAFMSSGLADKLGFCAAIALAAVTAACSQPPTTIILGDSDGDGDGTDGSGGSGSSSGSMTTGGGTDTAHDKFVNDVYPAIVATCGSCHAASGTGAPVFLAANAEASYTAITSFTPTMIAVPDNSTLILHGAHTGPALDLTQEQKVADWLMMEVEERGLAGGGGGTPPPTKTLATALEEFADCMTLEDWEASGMDNLPNAQTGNAGACVGCHNAGDGGTFLSLNVEETFSRNQDFPYIKRLVTGTVDAQTGNFDDLVPARRFIEKGQEPCGENQNCHPKYSLPPNLVTAVETFTDLTLQKWHAGTCGTTP
jgi:cytochrome c553